MKIIFSIEIPLNPHHGYITNPGNPGQNFLRLIKLIHNPKDAVIIKKFLFLLMEFDGISLSATFELN